MNKIKKVFKVVVVCLCLTPLMLYSSITWISKAPMPTIRSYICAGMIDNKIYVFGGANSSGVLNTVEMYDPASDTWETMAPMPTARRMPACAVFNDKIYVIGGEAGGVAYGDVDVYDPSTNTWETGASMPTPRSGHAVTIVRNRIYAIGGNCVDWTAINTVEAYDPVSDTWEARADMPTSRFWLTAGVINDSLIYAIGGGEDDFYGFSTVEVYDPLTDVWQTVVSMPSPRFGPASVEIDNIIYTIGGFDVGTAFVPLDVVEGYEEDTDGWFSESSMPTGRYLAAGVEAIGKIYVIGGFTSYATGYSGVNEEGTVIIGVEEDVSEVINSAIQLLVCPNPFVEKTEIRYKITSDALKVTDKEVRLSIHDATGRVVWHFENVSVGSPGRVLWHGTDQNNNKLPGGVYFLSLDSCDNRRIEKLILTR